MDHNITTGLKTSEEASKYVSLTRKLIFLNITILYFEIQMVKCDSHPLLDPLSKTTYRMKHNIPYYINTARNVAIVTSTTHYILPSDSELYPSKRLIPEFLKFVTRGEDPAFKRADPRVFVLPIFEIKEDHSVPDDKPNLIKLFKQKIVIPFHQNVCSFCHKIPKVRTDLF